MITQLRQAWKSFIERYPWHHYGHLSFKNPVTEDGAKVVFGSFARRVERLAGGPVWWFMVVEEGWHGARTHVHAVLGGTDRLSTATIRKAWEAGHSKVSEYDPSLGGVNYMTKTALYKDLEFEISSDIEQSVARWKALRSDSRRRGA